MAARCTKRSLAGRSQPCSPTLIPARLAALARTALLGVIACAVGGRNLPAADLEFWTDPSYVLARTERFTWSATGTLRFGNFPSRPYDRRAGAELEYTITNRVGVEFDYVFRNRNDRGPRRNENRLVAGVNYTLVRRGFEVEGKSLYERHIVELAPNFNRYRQQFDMARGGKGLSPWLHQDFTFRQGRGFVRTRTRFGLLWAGDVSTIRAAYQFESISVGTAWAPRHALYTEVEINNPLWGVD